MVPNKHTQKRKFSEYQPHLDRIQQELDKQHKWHINEIAQEHPEDEIIYACDANVLLYEHNQNNTIQRLESYKIVTNTRHHIQCGGVELLTNQNKK